MRNHVREFRRAAGLTQEILAQRVGVTRNTVSAIEGGSHNPSLELALKIAREFNRPVEEIFHLVEFCACTPTSTITG